MPKRTDPRDRLPSWAVFVLAIFAVPVGVIVVLIALLFGYSGALYLTQTYGLGFRQVSVHYRFTFGVEVAGVAYNGSTVVRGLYQQVMWWQVVSDPGFAAFHDGQASCVKLADGRMICLLPVDSSFVRGRKYFYPGVNGLAARLLSVNGSPTGPKEKINDIFPANAATVTGSSDIPMSLLPPIIILDDPSNPSSAHVFNPEQPERSLGLGARFLGARIAVTNEPVSRGIETLLPWLADPKTPQELTNSNDPFPHENGGLGLYKFSFARRLPPD
jgi:hypothetical protein